MPHKCCHLNVSDRVCDTPNQRDASPCPSGRRSERGGQVYCFVLLADHASAVDSDLLGDLESVESLYCIYIYILFISPIFTKPCSGWIFCCDLNSSHSQVIITECLWPRKVMISWDSTGMHRPIQ